MIAKVGVVSIDSERGQSKSSEDHMGSSVWSRGYCSVLMYQQKTWEEQTWFAQPAH